MKSLLLTISALLLLSCNSKKENIENDKGERHSEPTFEVHYFGKLKDIMHKGDLSAKFDLKEIDKLSNIYALGAIEDLKGEIQIFNGIIWNTIVQKDSVFVDAASDCKAALFVYAEVPKWEHFDIPANIRTKDQFETYIDKTAKEYGIDVHSPFPFLVKGTIDYLDWHVINWPEGDTKHTHEKHVNSGLNGTISNEKVELLGFYSDSHHAIFTHHTTNMHIHFKVENTQLAGHLDEMKLGDKMKLFLPKNKNVRNVYFGL